MAVQQSPYQFVKSTVNGETVYDALPPGQLFGGQTPITYDEWKSGVLSSNRYQLAQKTGDYLGPLGLTKEKFDALISGNMASGYASSPTNPGNFAPVQAIQQDMANEAAVQAGTMKKLANGGYVPTGSPADLLSQGKAPESTTLPQFKNLVTPNFSVPTQVDMATAANAPSRSSVMSKAQALAPNANLQVGSQGKDVEELQRFLIAQGYDIPALSTGTAKYGFFGEQTKAALTKFQEAQKIQAGQYFGYYGPKTREAANALISSTSKATTVDDANKNLTSAGMKPIQMDEATKASIDPTDIPSMFSYYINQMRNRQSKLDEAQAEVSKMMTEYAQRQVGIEGKTIPLSTVGKQLQNLKEFVTTQIAPYQNQVELLTKQLGVDREMMNTMLAYGKYMQDMNKPTTFELSPGQTAYQLMADGTVKALASRPKDSSELTTLQQMNINERSNVSRQLLDSRYSGKEADGIYADPNLYANLRASSNMSASEFDNRYGYLVNPISRKNLGITSSNAGEDTWGKPTPSNVSDVLTAVEKLDANTKKTVDIERLKTDSEYFYWVKGQIGI